jgi:hypothetical protein
MWRFDSIYCFDYCKLTSYLEPQRYASHHHLRMDHRVTVTSNLSRVSTNIAVIIFIFTRGP